VDRSHDVRGLVDALSRRTCHSSTSIRCSGGRKTKRRSDLNASRKPMHSKKSLRVVSLVPRDSSSCLRRGEIRRRFFAASRELKRSHVRKNARLSKILISCKLHLHCSAMARSFIFCISLYLAIIYISYGFFNSITCQQFARRNKLPIRTLCN